MTRLHTLALVGLLAIATQLVPSRADAAKKKKKTGNTAASATDPKKTLVKPGQQAASTKGIEEKLKKVEQGDEEPTRLAPAKLDTQGAVSKDDKADKARDEFIKNIIKIIDKQKDPDTKADLSFRLAEAYWEKSRYVRFNQEMPAYQVEAEKWSACNHAGKTRKECGAEPRPNTRLSETYRAQAVNRYQLLITDYPKYRRLDEVMFILAYNKMEMAALPENAKNKAALTKDGNELYRKILALYSKSNFVCDANVELGNYYFDNNQLAPARHAFEDGAKCPKTATYATYKLAWCDYNFGDFQMAVKRFKDVIARADRETADKVRLKSEALRDLVLGFEKTGELDTAIDYFTKVAGRQGSKPYIVKLANAYYTQGGYDYAIKSFRYLMKELPVDPSAPEWQSKVLLAYDKMGKRVNVREEARKLVHDFAPGSTWYGANQKDKIRVQFAYDVAEDALYNLVTDYHQEAIKTKSAATYKLSRDIYKEYIDNFPATERSYQMRYYYAEILYALEDYQNAYAAYLVVAQDKKQDSFKINAAKNMLIAAEKLVKIESGEYVKVVKDDSAVIDEDKAKGAIDAKKMKVVVNKKQETSELTALEKQFIGACDKYLELLPKADDEAQVRLSAAVIFFDHARYVEASDRFAFIIQKWPQEPSSASAAALILEALEAKEEWAALNKRATEFQANSKLIAGTDQRKKDFREKLPVYIEGSSFKLASIANDKEKDYTKAANLFGEFVKKFPKSKLAPIALYNLLLIHQNAKELDLAIADGEKFLADYPKADSDDMRMLPGATEKRQILLPDVTFRLAKSYELTADFANAAKYYEVYVANFPAEKGAPDAQFNAGLWYRGLGEPEKAVTAFNKYIAVYQKKTPKEQTELKLVTPAAVTREIIAIYENHKQWAKVITAIDGYLKTYAKTEEPYRALDATYHLLLANKELGKDKEVKRIAEELQTASKMPKLSDEDKKRESSKLAMGHSHFITIEPEYQKFLSLKFRSAQTLVQDLNAELAQIKKVSDAYTGVVKDGNGDWAIAALVRTASMPRDLAKDIRESPIPKGLTPDQVDIYKANLEDKATEFETKAIDLYETAMKKSFDLGIYNEWTLEAEKVLGEFKPDLFSEVKEIPLKGSEFYFTPAAAGRVAGSGSN
jgi:tetratricopeptide (TPR) repeat protein